MTRYYYCNNLGHTYVLNWYNRPTVLVPALGLGGAPRNLVKWPIARLLRKKADQRAKLEASWAPILPR